MKIVSKQRDYYDIGQGLGYDASVTYIRTPKQIDSEEHLANEIHVGFCGEIYPALHLSQYYDFSYCGKTPTPAYCYKPEDVDRWVDEHYADDERKFYYDNVKVKHPRHLLSRKKIVRFFEQQWDRGYKRLFAEHNTPIFVIDHSEKTIFINPLLRPYQFQKVKDPYTAYQEIEQYVGGVLLNPVPEIPDVPDHIMVEIKGFDPKWGFRNPGK